jgi:hypothetical protein
MIYGCYFLLKECGCKWLKLGRVVDLPDCFLNIYFWHIFSVLLFGRCLQCIGIFHQNSGTQPHTCHT